MDYLKYEMEFSVVFIVLVLFVPVSSYNCPVECDRIQKGNDVRAICRISDNELSSFNFSILALQDTTALKITCNECNCTLQPQMFQKLYRLKNITISNCNLEYLDESFAGLNDSKNLETLTIVNSSWHGLSTNSLCMLSKIHTLDFSGNQINSTSQAFNLCSHEQSFFSELTSFKLDFNQIRILESGFVQRLTNLQILSLKGNNIEKIQVGALTNLSRLKYLDVSQNNLTQLPDDFLFGCSRVQSLIISNNFITKIPPSVSELKNLRILYAGQTPLTDINLLEQSSLIKLKLYNSSLTTIPPRLCGNNSALEELDLGQNSISKVPPDIFRNCTKLQLLDLSRNNISTLFNKSFEGLKRLNTLNLSSNIISSCDRETFLNMTNLIELCLGFNSLSEIPFIPANLISFDLRNNQIHSISDKFFSHYISFDLRSLRLANNRIQKIESGAFRVLRNLLHLDLKKNKLSMLNKFAFKDLKMLIKLDISYNRISDIYKTLNKLVALNSIYAQYNLITKLQPNTFTKYVSHINVSNNHIRTVENGTFANLTYLKTVDLRRNRIVTLRPSSVKVGSRNSKCKFYISGNLFECNCEQAWLKRDKIRESKIGAYPDFQDLEKVMCFKRGKHPKPVLEYDKGFCSVSTQHRGLVGGLSIGLVLIVAIFITGTFLYRYRTEIQILFFVRFGWRILLKKRKMDEEDKKYDAFVSFHNSQDSFVVNEMIPRLEGTNPAYKLCIHLRDFTAGTAIVDNITESIENSRRTILLLNNQFLASEWCRYEFQAAHIEAFSNKLNSLILVLLEDISPDLVDGGLKLYMKTNTYLRYDDPKFWDKLRFALPEKKENVSEISKLKDYQSLEKGLCSHSPLLLPSGNI